MDPPLCEPEPVQPNKTAAALIIGNELLSGKIADANLQGLAQTLSEIGIKLVRVVMVLDDRAVIAAELRALSAAHDVVFTSGGVGPTHDDLTVDGVADAFDVEVAMAPELESTLRQYYGEAITDAHLRMARAPIGAEMVVTKHMPWPTVVMRNVWLLPGVPQIFAMKMPVVREVLGGGSALISEAVYTKLDEGRLKPLLDAVVAEHPDVEIGSYPKWKEPRYRTKVTFDAYEAAPVQAARLAFEALLSPEEFLSAEELRALDER
jgi:molybdenum cofactor synthesis domain-containing protein